MRSIALPRISTLIGRETQPDAFNSPSVLGSEAGGDGAMEGVLGIPPTYPAPPVGGVGYLPPRYTSRSVVEVVLVESAVGGALGQRGLRGESIDVRCAAQCVEGPSHPV